MRTLRALTAPSHTLEGTVPKWQARDDVYQDDVYQVGQLLGMLVKGDAQWRIGTRDVRRLACSDRLEKIIYRCIGERRKREEEEIRGRRRADRRALCTRPVDLTLGVLRSLDEVHLAFTGILSKAREEAARAARRAGATVHGGPW